MPVQNMRILCGVHKTKPVLKYAVNGGNWSRPEENMR
jgi:hypothetical protein